MKVWIDGKWTAGVTGRALRVEEPATGKTLDRVPAAGAADVKRAVAAAAKAQRSWNKIPGVEKARYLHEVAVRMRHARGEIAEAMTREGGKPFIESLDEVEWSAACFDYYAEVGRHARGNSIPPVAEHQINFTVKEPYGVVGVITPFNFPLLLTAWKVAPALAAGNAVVVKAPDQTPLCLLKTVEALKILPRGTVNILTGTGPEAGEALVRDPGVAMIAFTGSTAVGKEIMKLAAEGLKKINLETSGIDPFIVCEDADLDVAAQGAVWARFLNAGQVCTSAKRFYVVKKVAAEFTRKFVAFTETLQVGDPMDPKTDIGPLISAKALEKVERQIKSALAEGARLLCGGKRLKRPGHFLEPTVLGRVRHDMTIVREEVFGPVAAITVVRDVDDAIRLADDSPYGLGASIYTNNLNYVMKAMERIKAGTFWVNDPLTDNDAGPFGGMRQSGIGRELGEEGLDAFRETKHVHIDYVQEVKPYWYPYRRRPWQLKEKRST